MTTCLGQLLSDSARHFPRNTAIIDAESGRKFSYKELDHKVYARAAVLAARGIRPGDRIALLSKNSPDLICAYLASSRAGAIPVPLNHILNVRDNIRQIKCCGAKALFYGSGLKSEASSIAAGTRSVRFIFNGGPESAGVKSPVRCRCRPGEPATIIFTSGTTGEPLGVTLSHRNIISNARAVAEYAGLGPDDSVMCVLPLCYIYGLSLVFSHLLAGGSIVIENRFAYPNTVTEGMERFGVTGFAGVSSHYSILLDYSDIRKRRLPKIRYFMQAGDAMPGTLTEVLTDTFPDKKLYLMYGQTEAGPRLTYLDPGLVKRKPASVGRAIPGVRIKIVSPAGRACRIGEAGEIIAKGDSVMIGYWRNRRETGKVLKNGWLYTGDIGFMDKDGDIFITGRKNGILKVGGRRIGLSELERLASEYNGVGCAVAVPARDKTLGHRVRLFVSLRPGARIDAASLKDHCAAKLPVYARAIDIEILRSIPRTNYGKVDRKSLEEHS